MNLATCYMGLELANPLVAGAGPLTGELSNVRRLEDAGAGAIVLPSIFEEEIEHEQQAVETLTAAGGESYGEALSYFPAPTADARSSERYLGLIEHATRTVDIPVIASLNGITNHGWVKYAQQIEVAGAHAIELNIYFLASDPDLTGPEVEQRHIDILKAVKETVTIPVAVKIGPYFSAVAEMARRLDEAGANALVLFNRFYKPDIDLARLTLTPALQLSVPHEMRLPLFWISILSQRLKTSLAASTGVDTVDEVIKYLLAGADVVMTTSALLRHGIEHMAELRQGLESWVAARGFESVEAIRGLMSHPKVSDPIAFDHAGYFNTLRHYKGNSDHV